MYRTIKAIADTYITSKIIENSRSLDSNVGQAGTIDIYKLYNETEYNNESEVIELSRGLIKFDYSTFSGTVNVNSPSFKAKVILKDVYGGQTTPSNFSLVLYPLSRAFDEGRGFDVASYKDIDTANFLKCSSGINWVVTGADAKGMPGENVDIIVSGNFGNGIVDLGSICTFSRGDEDGIFDITTAVSAALAGNIENHGFRLSFIEPEEIDNKTRFVKRFGARQALNKDLHPRLIIEYDDRVIDTTANPLFNVSQSFFVYNSIGGNYSDFIIAGIPQENLIMELISSKSISYITSSFQANFNQEIEHLTSSIVYFSQSFSGSKVDTGIYNCNFILDLSTNTELVEFIEDKNEIGFDVIWKTEDGNQVAKNFVKFNYPYGSFSNANEPNYILNVTNLKREYSIDQVVRIKIFIQDRTKSVMVSRAMETPKSVVLPDVRWRLKKAYSKSIVIPFTEATRLSSDSESMYFDLYMCDLDINEVYELEFIIKNDQGKDILFTRKGFTFKVVE